jgi:hypothetical protein
MLPLEPYIRLNQTIDTAWEILFERIVSGCIKINKESSMQLHLSKIIFDLGNIYCILPNENFEIEMETNYENKSIDIVCQLGEVKAAIELKCFRKASNRAKEIDCYDSLIDIERLQQFTGFQLKKFICLTDNKYYSERAQTGHGKTVSLRNGTIYPMHTEIIPGWVDKWKINRDKPIVFNKDIRCDWTTRSDWHFWKVDI